MLVQFVYCNRLAYMEWVQGEFASNAYVADGRYQHRNVDKVSGRKKLQEDTGETIHASLRYTVGCRTGPHSQD